MGKIRLLFGTVAVAAVLATAVPASAIQRGDLDGNGHPHVGLMVAFDANGAPLWRCSGTLISDRVFLTAGHCTEAPAATAQIFFDADVQSLSIPVPYPFQGDASGDVYTHPNYNPQAFFQYDLGVVLLDAPYTLSNYGELPTLGQLNSMDKKRRNEGATFRSVGYGLQRIIGANGRRPPSHLEADRVRMVAYPHLLQINRGLVGDFAVLLSNNASTGGTCFGDSGGPNFIGETDVIGGVTSFGINFNCAGTAGVYRVDQADDLNWLYNTFGSYLP
jgi:secreted trypsin-like serine protease